MQSLEPLKGDISDYLLQGCCSGFKRRQVIFLSAPTFDWRCVKCCVCYILVEGMAAILWVLKSCVKCLFVVWMVTRTPAAISRQLVKTQSAGWHLLSANLLLDRCRKQQHLQTICCFRARSYECVVLNHFWPQCNAFPQKKLLFSFWTWQLTSEL